MDDEALVRRLVADELRGHGYSILEPGSGDEAWVLRGGAQVDLVFTDVRCRADRWYHVGMALKFEFPKIRVIVASGLISEIPIGAADGFFLKPYDLATVARKIETDLTAQPGAASACVLVRNVRTCPLSSWQPNE